MRDRMPGFIMIVVVVVIGAVVFGGPLALAQAPGVDVRDDVFVPATITVTAGDTVVWTHSGSNPHSVTADDGSFDSHPSCPGECMGPGDTFTQTFTEPGEIGYYCKIHGSPGQGMAGTVVVEAASEEPAPEPAPDTTDQPGDTGEPAEPNTQTDETVGQQQDRSGDAEEAQQLPETGGRWALLVPLALVTIVAGLVAVRRAHVRDA